MYYLLNSESEELYQSDSRRKVRVFARKNYRKEYQEKKTFKISFGNNLNEAIVNLMEKKEEKVKGTKKNKKVRIDEKTGYKLVRSTKPIDPPKKKKKAKKEKVKVSRKEVRNILSFKKEEEKQIKRINKRNMKMNNTPLTTREDVKEMLEEVNQE